MARNNGQRVTEIMHGIVNGRIGGGQTHVEEHAQHGHERCGSQVKGQTFGHHQGESGCGVSSQPGCTFHHGGGIYATAAMPVKRCPDEGDVRAFVSAWGEGVLRRDDAADPCYFFDRSQISMISSAVSTSNSRSIEATAISQSFCVAVPQQSLAATA